MPLYTKQVSIVLCCCVYLKEYAYSEKSNIEIKTYCACACCCWLLAALLRCKQTKKKSVHIDNRLHKIYVQHLRMATMNELRECNYISSKANCVHTIWKLLRFFFASSSPLFIHRPFVGACGRRN